MSKFYTNHIYYAVSDLHGQGKYYDYIMQLLENEQAKEENRYKRVTLIIIGDIVDRGPDSIRMLIDVMSRVKKQEGNIEVIMTVGNHEWMMYQALRYYFDKGYWSHDNQSESGMWFNADNHGYYTSLEFLKLEKNLQRELFEFLGSLPLCYTLQSNKSGEDSYAFIHAAPFSNIMAISDDQIPTLEQMANDHALSLVNVCLTARLYDLPSHGAVPGGISVVGHTPIDWKEGYQFLEKGRIICIDGGCGHIANNPESVNTGVATLLRLVPGKCEFQKIDIQGLRQGGPHYLNELERLRRKQGK